MSDEQASTDKGATIALAAEEMVVERRVVEGATTRVDVVTTAYEQPVEDWLTQTRVEIKRVPIGHLVDALPDTREEGDVTIVSVVEEVLVVERRLRLKEEVHIRRVSEQRHVQETVTLRDQKLSVSRVENEEGSDASSQPIP